MKKALITTSSALFAILFVTTATYAIGSLTPSGTTGDDTQYSLNDIYAKLADFSDTPTATSSPFAVPGSVSASFRTLSEIYGLLEAEEDDLVAANIADGVTIFGVEGTMSAGGGESEPGMIILPIRVISTEMDFSGYNTLNNNPLISADLSYVEGIAQYGSLEFRYTSMEEIDLSSLSSLEGTLEIVDSDLETFELPSLVYLSGNLKLQQSGLSSQVVDNLFISLASTVVSGNGQITVGNSGSDLPTSASSDARAYLTGLGISISIDYGG